MDTSQLTFTRFVAAFLIVLLHFTGDLFPMENDFINVMREKFYLGVDYFYVLSGFVMMLAYGNADHVKPLNYLKNRLARVYPLHLFTLLLTIVISLFLSLNYLEYYKFNFKAFFTHILLIQSWIPQYSLTFNVPSWSVSTEMFFYLCFPFLLNHFIKKVNWKTFVIITILFWLTSQIGMNLYYFSESYGGYESLSRYFLFYNPFLHLNTFMVGLWFGAMFNKYRECRNKNYDLVIIITMVACSLLVYIFKDLMVHNGLFAIPFGLIIFLVAGNKGHLTQIFRHRLLIHLGEISFALYLLQNPVFILLRKVFAVLNVDAPYTLFFLGCIILLISSHFTYLYIEKPARKWIKNITL